MSPIDALSLAFQPQTVQPARASQAIMTDGESINFAALLSSITLEGQVVNEGPNDEQLQEQLKAIEEGLQNLQELPQQTLTAEDEEIVYGMLQLYTMQNVDVEEIEVGLPKQRPDTFNHEKMASIMNKGLPHLMPTPIVIDDPPAPVMHVGDGEQTKLELVMTKMIADLEGVKKSLVEGNSLSVQQTTRIEQLLQQLQQLTGLTQDTKSPVQVTPVHHEHNPENKLMTKQTAVNTAAPITQIVGARTEENTNQTQLFSLNNAQNTPKIIQTPVQPVTTEPTQTIRMSHLIKELESVFRGSFKVTGNPEATQIRVNITPDHLGHLDIRFTEINGKITAQIFTSTIIAKEVLDLQMHQLRHSLVQQGVQLEKIDIAHQNSPSFEQQADRRFSEQQGQEKQLVNNNEYERNDEEKVVQHKHVESSMNVDYTV